MPLQVAAKIVIAHSPDPDDAFMFYALAKKKIDPGPFAFEHVLSDIETLNKLAFEGKYEITAVSLHAFAHLTDIYHFLPVGASIGKGYGPIVVARKPLSVSDLPKSVIAIPGIYTTARLTLGLAVGNFEFKVFPFDEIMNAVQKGEADAGLLIHEGQITYGETGLIKILDLGEWWEQKTGLPLPLGVDVVRKDLGIEKGRDLAKILKESIRYAMDHEDEAVEYARLFGRGLDRQKAKQFVRMYVNERTLEYSEADKKAISLLLDEGYRRGIIPVKPQVSFQLCG